MCVCVFFFKALSPGLYHYYVTELAFYWSLMFSQFTDIKRKVSVCHYCCTNTSLLVTTATLIGTPVLQHIHPTTLSVKYSNFILLTAVSVFLMLRWLDSI